MTGLLQDHVRNQAQLRPDAAAVRLLDEVMTYGELDRLSDQLAAALYGVGCRRGDRVCVLQEKSPRSVLSFLGALKADCTYVPVDVNNPAPRLLSILSQTEPAVILLDGAGSRSLGRIAADSLPPLVRLGWMDRGEAPEAVGPAEIRLKSLESAADGAPPTRGRTDDLAHILFTSGSTGVPKGVTITHANVWHFIEWAKTCFGLGPDERISGHSPFHFDLSTFDIYGSFAAGAELHLVPSEMNLIPPKLAEFIRRSELTQWFSVPSILSYLARWDVVRPGDFPSLRRLLWCGEVFPTAPLTYWMKRLPHVRFTNLYGPTEATIASSYHTLPACPANETEEIPIGRACAGEELLVLGADLERVPAGETGELYIRGVGLSPGYWRDEERSRAAFIRDPVSGDRLYRTGDLARMGGDGLVHFMGRADSQIKSRGYRIELGEIEAALATLEYLTECAVVAIDSTGFDGKVICCAFVCRSSADALPLRIRKDLQQRLPSYMIPARWLEFERLPRNANGKIDRRELGERFERRGVAAG